MGFWEKIRKPKTGEKSKARQLYEQYHRTDYSKAAAESLNRWLGEVHADIEAMQKVLNRPLGDPIWAGDELVEKRNREQAKIELEKDFYIKADLEGELNKRKKEK